jgi:hypothetical protein
MKIDHKNITPSNLQKSSVKKMKKKSAPVAF